jgi:hypothetical protein
MTSNEIFINPAENQPELAILRGLEKKYATKVNWNCSQNKYLAILNYYSANIESDPFTIMALPGDCEEMLHEAASLLCEHAGYSQEFMKILRFDRNRSIIDLVDFKNWDKVELCKESKKEQ